MKQIYKSVSFPKALNKVSDTKVLKLAFGENDKEIANLIRDLDSSQIRTLLNNRTIEELEAQSRYDNRSLNSTAILIIKDNLAKYKIHHKNQLELLFATPSSQLQIDAPSVTFKNNKKRDIFNWYPYIEGFSYDFVGEILDYVITEPKFIFDPFAGTGTTVLVACQRNINSGFAEINPFMKFIIETKINALKNYESRIKPHVERVLTFLENLKRIKITSLSLNNHFGRLVENGFFRDDILKQLVVIKEKIQHVNFNQLIKDILLLALSSIIVKESNMIRRADLRYKRENELNEIEADVIGLFVRKCKAIIADLDNYKNLKLGDSEFVSANAKQINESYNDKFDLVITSPPYVNGTNYFRNTKLELLFLDFIESEDELKYFRAEAVTSGINNVSNRKYLTERLDYVRPIVQNLEKSNYDPRIPKLVEYYFNDMKIVFKNIFRVLTDNGDFFIDIGDSKFKDVHVPTDLIYEKIGEDVGFELIEKRKVRNRFSKDGSPLGQWLLHFKKNRGYSRRNVQFQVKNIDKKYFSSKQSSPSELVVKNWELFRDRLPYLQYPYNKRNWGNELHSLCSYQGKLKPAIAHFLVKYFTTENMTVLDPLCGVGTIPFEAALQGRIAYGNDLSLLAYTNTLAKIGEKSKGECFSIIEDLSSFINHNLPSDSEIEALDIDFNKHIRDYYHPETMKQIVAARNYFKQMKINTASDAAVFASLLHILHGNRPYALSRTSHPITPFAPKGEFVYKDLVMKLKEKISRVLNIEMTPTFRVGFSIWDDFSNLHQYLQAESIDTIITSPPFYDSTRFYLANWIRMWFSGWDKEDFNIQKEQFLETKQVRDINIYNKFFDKCYYLLKSNGSIIMHLGFSKKANMAEMLIPIAQRYFQVVGYFNENVNNRENFGISDVGTVKMHQFLFLIKE